jgi:hypothetical protein
MRWYAGTGAAVILVASCAGCATLGPADPRLGSAGFAFEEAWATQSFTDPPDRVGAVLPDSMIDLKMQLMHRSQPVETSAVLDGQAHDGRHVRVVVRSRGAGSVVSCRIGRFGDEALCKALMERIGVRLGVLPATAIPDEPPTSSPFRSLFSKFAVPDAKILREQADAGYRDTPVP